MSDVRGGTPPYVVHVPVLIGALLLTRWLLGEIGGWAFAVFASVMLVYAMVWAGYTGARKQRRRALLARLAADMRAVSRREGSPTRRPTTQ